MINPFSVNDILVDIVSLVFRPLTFQTEGPEFDSRSRRQTQYILA